MNGRQALSLFEKQMFLKPITDIKGYAVDRTIIQLNSQATSWKKEKLSYGQFWDDNEIVLQGRTGPRKHCLMKGRRGIMGGDGGGYGIRVI